MENILHRNRIVAVTASLLAIGLGVWLCLPSRPLDPDGKPIVAKAKRVPHDDADLLAQTKITHDEATKMALAKVPNSAVSVTELEDIDGRVAWTYDLKVPGVPGVAEVEINAKTGEFIKFDPPKPR